MNMRSIQTLGGLLLASLSLLLAGQANGQENYPSHPIKVIVPTTAGSNSDITARLMADEMGRRLGQQIVVENRAGAGGSIGTEAVAKATPDGYTLLMGASSVMVMLPAVSRRKLPYDPDVDFAPIGRIHVSSFVLVVSAKSSFNSFADVVKAAKAQPGRISYASAGPATNPHLLGEMLSVVSGTSLNHVPYKGPGPAQMDVLGGNVDLQFDTPPSVLPLIRSGKLRALAVTGETRVTSLPDVPTVVELGYPQLRLNGWTALYAPRSTPAGALAKLRLAFRESMQSPKIRTAIADLGNEPDGMMGDALLQEQYKSREVWRKLAASRGIALD